MFTSLFFRFIHIHTHTFSYIVTFVRSFIHSLNARFICILIALYPSFYLCVYTYIVLLLRLCHTRAKPSHAIAYMSIDSEAICYLSWTVIRSLLLLSLLPCFFCSFTFDSLTCRSATNINYSFIALFLLFIRVSVVCDAGMPISLIYLIEFTSWLASYLFFMPARVAFICHIELYEFEVPSGVLTAFCWALWRAATAAIFCVSLKICRVRWPVQSGKLVDNSILVVIVNMDDCVTVIIILHAFLSWTDSFHLSVRASTAFLSFQFPFALTCRTIIRIIALINLSNIIWVPLSWVCECVFCLTQIFHSQYFFKASIEQTHGYGILFLLSFLLLPSAFFFASFALVLLNSQINQVK